MLRPPDTIESGVQQWLQKTWFSGIRSFGMIVYDLPRWTNKIGPEMMSEEVRLVFSEAFVTHIVSMMHDVTLPRSAQYCFMKPFQLIKSWHGHSSNLQRVKTGVSQSHFKCYWGILRRPAFDVHHGVCWSYHLQLSFWHPRSYGSRWCY